MAEYSKKKYYWLKLKRDFFKKHNIKIVEAMDNGKDYILFYLKLLCESIDHDGNLRFSDTIPYNEKMLAALTDTNIDIVRSASKVFIELQMMEQLDDGTIYMNEVKGLIGMQTEGAERKQIQRDNHPLIPIEEQQGGQKVDKCPPDIRYKNLDIRDKNKDKKENINTLKEKKVDEVVPTPEKNNENTNKFVKPTLQEIDEYCVQRQNGVDAEAFYSFYESKGWLVGKVKMKQWKSCVITFEKNNRNQEAGSNPNRKPKGYIGNELKTGQDDISQFDLSEIDWLNQ